MTAFIPHISSRPTLKALGINNMLKAVIYRLEEMNKSMDQLKSVAKLVLSYNLKKDCLSYIEKQYKLIEITQNLKERLSKVCQMDRDQIAMAYRRNHLQQLIQEVDLLFEMHFQVKKSYITFLHKYYKPQARRTKVQIKAHSMVA